MTFAVEALERRHDRSRFACGSAPLDRYIRELASQDVRRRTARVFVAVPDGGGAAAAGFYTLSAVSIARGDLPEAAARRLPRYPVPAALLGRLAVDRGYGGRGLGASLLADALRRVARAGETVAVYAMVVDAKDERAQAFYERFGFVRLPDAGRRLFLPMAAAARLPTEGGTP